MVVVQLVLTKIRCTAVVQSTNQPSNQHTWNQSPITRPLPPRAASRLSGLVVRRLRCFVPKQRHAQCRADLGKGPGHTLKNVQTTNHQSPFTRPRPVLRFGL